MKILISLKTNNFYYHKGDADYHCKEGMILKDEIFSGKKKVKANTNREFLIFDASEYDYSRKIKRGPQIITSKDLGYVMARTRINKNSYVVEAGGGSGAATCFFASIVDRVDTYEIVEEHYKIIKSNLESLKLNNVNLFHKDLAEDIKDKKDIDMLFLDMPEPNHILKEDLSGIKSGKYIVCYIPSITQVQEIVSLVQQEGRELYLEEITEVSIRHWKVTERIARPEHQKEIDHTAFLVFIRKI